MSYQMEAGMVMETAPILDEEELSADESPVRRIPRTRIGLVVASLLGATALFFVASRSSAPSLFRTSANPKWTGLHEDHEEHDHDHDEHDHEHDHEGHHHDHDHHHHDGEECDDPCEHLPFLRIMGIKTNNLGGHGPDKDAEEGIVYKGVAHHLGTNTTEVEVHMHAVSHTYFAHSEAEGANISHNYQPQWPKVNGVKGHFGTINVQPGSNVTVQVHGYDPEKEEDILLPKFAITFFDLDTGRDGTHSVEFLKTQGFSAYFVTNETEINITSDEDGATRFTATVEGTGDDNPDDPLILTEQQKNRAVSFEFDNTNEVVFELGCSEGKTARVFQFVVRPIMRCAQTKLSDGSLVGATDPNSPISLVRGSANGRPVTGLAAVVALLALPFWL